MRIIQILDTFGGGGKERRCLQLIQGLNREGYRDIEVVILKNDIAYHELYDTSAHVHIIDRKEQGLTIFETSRKIKSLIEEFNPDIVQAWGWVSALSCLLIRPFLKFHFIASYVANVQRPQFGQGGFIVNGLCKRVCDRIVGNSREGLKVYGIPKDKACLIYNGFNETRLLKTIDVEDKKKELNINTPYVISMIASFGRTKDWDCYLETASSIIKKRDDITFLAVGYGVNWEKYNETISKEEAKRIRMLGRRVDIDEILQVCDLTVLTSKYGEGISNSIMESMAFGVPVIATNAGGTPEIIKDNINGMLLISNNQEELEKAIYKLIDDEQLRTRLGMQARHDIKKIFSLTNMTQSFISLYKSVVTAS